jgi:Ca2+-binding EF-hand superfamily protein
MTAKFVFAALAGSACLLAAASGFANDAKDKVATPGSFATLDRNGDNRLSRSEAGFDRRLSETFVELDTDGDGFVSAAEFAAGEKNRTTVGKLTPQ